MKIFVRYLAIITLIIASCISCDTDRIDLDEEKIDSEPIGTLQVNFKISHPWIPKRRIIRTDLHIAKNGIEVYKGNYIESANVTDFQENYFFYLSPGTYYYEAGISCICGGDSCSAGGFPGNQFGEKHTMGQFTIKVDEVTSVTPTFQ